MPIIDDRFWFSRPSHEIQLLIYSGCYRTGSAKITMGTGSFLDVVTDTPHASLNGLIPLVAWRIPRYCDQSQVT